MAANEFFNGYFISLQAKARKRSRQERNKMAGRDALFEQLKRKIKYGTDNIY